MVSESLEQYAARIGGAAADTVVIKQCQNSTFHALRDISSCGSSRMRAAQSG